MAIGSSPANVTVLGNVTSPQTVATPTNGNYEIPVQLVGPGGTVYTSPAQTNLAFSHLAAYAVNRKLEAYIGAVSASPGSSLAWGGGAGFNGIVVEWAGLDGGFDSTNSAGSSANLAISTTASVTPAAGTNCLLLAGLSRAGTYSSGPTGGWTDVTGSTNAMRLAYLVVNGASGSYSTAWTYLAAAAYDTYIWILTAPSGGGGRTLFSVPSLDGLSIAGPKQFNPLG